MEGYFHGEKVVNNLIKSILLSLFIFNLALCSSIEGVNVPNISLSGSYNNPFINTSETLKIEEGMSYSSIIENIGQPLYVKSGNGLSKEVIWVYEVRTILVESSISGDPNKSSNNSKHAGLHHKLQIIFVNGKVNSWGPLSESKLDQDSDNKTVENDNNEGVDAKVEVDLKIDLKNKKNKSTFSIYGKLGPVLGEKFDAPTALGIGLLYKNFGGELITSGGDEYGYVLSITGLYQKEFSNIVVQAKLGYNESQEPYSDDYWEDYEDSFKSGFSAALGVGYKFNVSKLFLTPMLNLHFGHYAALTLNVGI